jgi:integrase
MQSQTEKPYYRLNVYDYIDCFCGWDPLTELVKYAGSPRNELYLLSLIKTGGRAGEVLTLNTDNFKLDKRSKTLQCKNMKLEKRWHKVKLPDGTTTRDHIEAVRKPFPILLRENLTKELVEHLALTPDGSLFPSPYKTHDPLTVSWGYKLILRINDELPRPLFQELGLDRPFNNDKGEKIAETIHLWQHWFRSQRASQLKEEYDFTESELMEFFGWMDYKTALHYSRSGFSKLAEKMRQHS